MNVYDRINSEIIKSLENNDILWQRPWKTKERAMNFITQKAYRGINAILTNFSKYSSPYWITFLQSKELGISIKKGEKSTPVVFCSHDDEEDDDSIDIDESSRKKRFVLRWYNIFNLNQTDLEYEVIDRVGEGRDTIDVCEEIISNMPKKPEIRNDDIQAYYSRKEDYINIPSIEYFLSSEEYYSTIFHELVHSTGHESRLNREELRALSNYGDSLYSKEELVAELGSAFLCGVANISPKVILNQAAYIRYWLDVLRKDKTFIFQVASLAQSAADYILGQRE